MSETVNATAPAAPAKPKRPKPKSMIMLGEQSAALMENARLAKERGEFALKGQILCYPYLDSVHQPSEKPHFAADMDQEVMEAFAALYCTQAQRTDPHVSPVCATLEQLRGLCPALVLLPSGMPCGRRESTMFVCCRRQGWTRNTAC